jgi:hypothetical protein
MIMGACNPAPSPQSDDGVGAGAWIAAAPPPDARAPAAEPTPDAAPRGMDGPVASAAPDTRASTPDGAAPGDAGSSEDAIKLAPVTVRMLSDGWMDATFGPTTRNGPTRPGLAAVSGNTMKVTGYGSGLVGKSQLGAESFYFVFRPLEGDGEISARILSTTHAAVADVGVMIRAGIDARAFHGMSGVRPVYENVGLYSAGFWRRYEISDASALPRMVKSVTLPIWVKAERSGATITASYSQDGRLWKKIEARTYTTFPASAFAGIAVMSGWSRATSATNAEIQEISVVRR